MGIRNTNGEFSFINTEVSSHADFSKIPGNSCFAAFLLDTYQKKSNSLDMIGAYEACMEMADILRY